MNAPMSLCSLSAAISSFQANSTSHLANYSESSRVSGAADFTQFLLISPRAFRFVFPWDKTDLSLCQDHSGLVHPLTPNHLTWQLGNNFHYHITLLIKLLCNSSEDWCLVPLDLPLASVSTEASHQKKNRCLGLQQCRAWCCLALTTTFTLLTPRTHCPELNITTLETMTTSRCLKPAPTKPSKLRGWHQMWLQEMLRREMQSRHLCDLAYHPGLHVPCLAASPIVCVPSQPFQWRRQEQEEPPFSLKNGGIWATDTKQPKT